MTQATEALVPRDAEHPGARLEHGGSRSERAVHREERRLARVFGILTPAEQVPCVAEHGGLCRRYSSSVARPGSRGSEAERPAPGLTGDGALAGLGVTCAIYLTLVVAAGTGSPVVPEPDPRLAAARTRQTVVRAGAESPSTSPGF